MYHIFYDILLAWLETHKVVLVYITVFVKYGEHFKNIHEPFFIFSQELTVHFLGMFIILLFGGGYSILQLIIYIKHYHHNF